MRVRRILPVCLIGMACLIGLSACSSGAPRRVDSADPNESVVGMGLDYADIVEIAGSLSDKLMSGSFLDRSPYREQWPIKTVLSGINNKTDLRDLPTEAIVQRIRKAGLNSGKLVFVATLGDGPQDKLVPDIQAIKNDPRFRQDQAPADGTLEVPELFLQTEILYFRSTDGRSRQNTYEVHMFVTDATGLIRWEDSSGPIGKRADRGKFGG